jgi:hypothetical protein
MSWVCYSGSAGFDGTADFGSAQTVTATPAFPSVTTSQGNSIVLGMVLGDSGAGANNGTPHAGWTHRVTSFNSSVNALNYGDEILQVNAGASPSQAPTLNGSSGSSWWTYAVAFKGSSLTPTWVETT